MGPKKKVLADTPTTRGRQTGFDNFGTHKSEAHNEKLKLKSFGVAPLLLQRKCGSSQRAAAVPSYPFSVG